jgi:hypothetical protein
MGNPAFNQTTCSVRISRRQAAGGRRYFAGSAVDKIEDAKSLELNKPQQSSTSFPHLIETEAAENRALLREAGIRLGRRGSGVQIAPPRPNDSIA